MKHHASVARMLGFCLIAQVGSALAQTTPNPAVPDPAQQRAQTAFEALPEAERRQIQLDLTFATDFSGAALGSFGTLTYRALQAFERQNKSTVDGVLEPAERTALAATAKRERDRLGFRQVNDGVTKASIGLPTALLPKTETQAGQGMRWQSADGKVTVATRLPAASEGTLEQIHEKATASSNPQRKVTYKLLRPDFSVVAGETPQGKFYLRMTKLPDGTLKGFSVSYDKALAPVWDKLTVAAANTWLPTGTATASAPATANTPTRPVMTLPDPFAPRSFARSLTGIVVAPGRILTSASTLKACAQANVGGRTLRLLAEDNGVALTQADGVAAPALAAPLSSARGHAAVLTQGMLADGARGLMALPADVEGAALSAALQPGSAGAPVFTPDGAFSGVVTSDPAVRVQVAGIVLVGRHRVAEASGIERLLTTQGLALPTATQGNPTALGLGGITARHGQAVVAISCGP